MEGKKFYKIGEIADFLNIPASTLRYWEKHFTILSPGRGRNGQRRYTAEDIEKIRKLYFLIKEKGLKLDAAQDMLRKNPDNVDKTYRAVERLRLLKSKIEMMMEAMERFRPE